MILEAITFGAATIGAVVIVGATTKVMRLLFSDKSSWSGDYDYQPEPVAVRPRKELLPNSVEIERRSAARSNSSSRTTSSAPLILFDPTPYSSGSGSTSCDHHSGHHHGSGGHHGYDSGSSGSDSGSYGGGSCD